MGSADHTDPRRGVQRHSGAVAIRPAGTLRLRLARRQAISAQTPVPGIKKARMRLCEEIASGPNGSGDGRGRRPNVK